MKEKLRFKKKGILCRCVKLSLWNSAIVSQLSTLFHLLIIL